jgi:uncharacterized DUF497 family protein
MKLSFEWNENKAAVNLTKYGVRFELAARVFHDPMRLERHDQRQDDGEDRFLIIGLVGGKELAVAYTLRDEVIRIISARKAGHHERREYWENR